MLRCESIAPLGLPVVPDVYCMLMASCGTEFGGHFLEPCCAARLGRDASNSSQGNMPGRGSPRSETTHCSLGSDCAVQFAGRGRRELRTRFVEHVEIVRRLEASTSASPRTSDWRRAYFNSPVRYAGLMFTSTTPIRAVANWSSTHSGTFVAHTPKWSPGVNPSASKPRATRSTAASNSPQVIRAGGLQKTNASHCEMPPGGFAQCLADRETVDPGNGMVCCAFCSRPWSISASSLC